MSQLYTKGLNFTKNLYLCNNESLKMDTGNLLYGVITNAMR